MCTVKNSAIYQISTKKLNELKKDFILDLDESILNSGLIVSLNIQDSNFRYYSEEDKNTPPFKIKILEGAHHLEMSLLENTEPSYKRKNVANTFTTFQVDKKTKGILLGLKENQISFEEIR